jgi:hypothetical protein
MEIQPLEILKWIGIVLAAGFIGYFGRYMAMLILERIHKKKAQQTLAKEETKEIPTPQTDHLEESRLKIEKKKAKQVAKQVKKARKG